MKISGNLKKLISLFILGIFLLPLIVKLEHHHEQFICKAKNEKHFHSYHETCPVCKFEFSAFRNDYSANLFDKSLPLTDAYYNHYKEKYFYEKNHSSLSRAPPLLT